MEHYHDSRLARANVGKSAGFPVEKFIPRPIMTFLVFFAGFIWTLIFVLQGVQQVLWAVTDFVIVVFNIVTLFVSKTGKLIDECIRLADTIGLAIGRAIVGVSLLVKHLEELCIWLVRISSYILTALEGILVTTMKGSTRLMVFAYDYIRLKDRSQWFLGTCRASLTLTWKTTVKWCTDCVVMVSATIHHCQDRGTPQENNSMAKGELTPGAAAENIGASSVNEGGKGQCMGAPQENNSGVEGAPKAAAENIGASSVNEEGKGQRMGAPQENNSMAKGELTPGAAAGNIGASSVNEGGKGQRMGAPQENNSGVEGAPKAAAENIGASSVNEGGKGQRMGAPQENNSMAEGELTPGAAAENIGASSVNEGGKGQRMGAPQENNSGVEGAPKAAAENIGASSVNEGGKGQRMGAPQENNSGVEGAPKAAAENIGASSVNEGGKGQRMGAPQENNSGVEGAPKAAAENIGASSVNEGGKGQRMGAPQENNSGVEGAPKAAAENIGASSVNEGGKGQRMGAPQENNSMAEGELTPGAAAENIGASSANEEENVQHPTQYIASGVQNGSVSITTLTQTSISTWEDSSHGSAEDMNTSKATLPSQPDFDKCSHDSSNASERGSLEESYIFLD